MAAMIIVIVWLGLYPHPVLDTARLPLQHLQQVTTQAPLSTPAAAARPAFTRGSTQVTSVVRERGRP
jgi:hypothetical protein